MSSLDQRQEMMRQRNRRRTRKAKAGKKRDLSHVTQEMRESEILTALKCFSARTVSLESLRLNSSCRPFGRGWWARTMRGLIDSGRVELVQVRPRTHVRLNYP
jgi:hypothetical protein